MENEEKGKFYDRAVEHCRSIGFDIVRYCGIIDNYSYYYLTESTRRKGYYGIYMIKFHNSIGTLTVVKKLSEILKAYNRI